MTNEEAVTIIRKEYLCVDRDCDIEKNCGKCDLVMPSKEPILEAYKMAIKALERESCEDAISRRAALDIYDDYNVAVENGELEAYRKHRKRLLKLPSVQPKPKTGHWILIDK